MSQDKDVTDDFAADVHLGIRLARLVMRAWAMSVAVFIHYGLGPRAPGVAGVVVFPLVFVYCLFWQHDHYSLSPMGWFLVAFLAALMRHRLAVLLGGRNRWQTHSEYDGSPWLGRVLPWFSEWTIKRFIEPLLIAMLGIALVPLSPPLGVYLLGAAICMRLSTFMAELYVRTQVRVFNDQFTSQRIVAERLREVRGDHF